MIKGRATPEGTAAFARRRATVPAHFWRTDLGLTHSSLGLGSYLGTADGETDAAYAAATRRALGLGINVIDSAINYRFQRSERAIGEALKKSNREELLLCTKGGFLSGDGGMPSQDWFEKTYIDSGVASFDDVVAGCHCMTPKYLQHELEQSRKNLDVETIDVYYVHNPETQIPEVGEDEFYKRLTTAFRALEECAAAGKIQWYGTATWDAYRVAPGAGPHLSLDRVLACAKEAGGDKHRFRVIQLPFNLAMPEALTEPTQGDSSALQRAKEAGFTVFTSVPLMQGQLLGRFNEPFQAKFPGLKTDAQRCLQFVRSAPGVAAPLAGMKDARHVEENFELSKCPPLADSEFKSFFANPEP